MLRWLSSQSSGSQNAQEPHRRTDHERIQDILAVDEDRELKHSIFVELCARAQLPPKHQFNIDDPQSEACLKTAVWVPEERCRKVQCMDVICNLKVPATASARRAAMRRQLEACHLESKDKLLAWARPAVTEKNIGYFQGKGLERQDAECCVWALSFYTGDGSKRASRAGSLIIRQGNVLSLGDAEQAAVQELLDKSSLIVYFLTLAMSTIPYYWGPVTRFVTLAKEDLVYYRPGNIVTWMQFASSRRGNLGGASFFSKRNAEFIIWSVKGRHIDRFSNYCTQFGHDEDEVLFLPFTRLLVLRLEELGGQRYRIHCREVELALTHGFPLLWVDDKVLEGGFKMKLHMEAAQVTRRQEIKFILKPSTDLAVAFLDSPFGRTHCERSRLRVMTDMSRPEEEDGGRAGAKFVKLLEDRGFTGFLMVFTSCTKRAVQYLREVGVHRRVVTVTKPYKFEPDVVLVTVCAGAAKAFCAFEGL